MSMIVLLDTTIYLNVLNVPGRNQDRKTVLRGFEEKIDGHGTFLLPFSVILETGNHIARLADGQTRRTYAQSMATDVKNALCGQLPYRPTLFPERDLFAEWLNDFPDWTMRVFPQQSEGSSLTDLTIVKEWEQTCERHPSYRVLIWSLDAHLGGYDRNPHPSP